MTKETCVVDVGAGDAKPIDQLIDKGLDCLAVLDVSGAALDRAVTGLGASNVPTWVETDVAGDWFLKPVDLGPIARSFTLPSIPGTATDTGSTCGASNQRRPPTGVCKVSAMAALSHQRHK